MIPDVLAPLGFAAALVLLSALVPAALTCLALVLDRAGRPHPPSRDRRP